jgi:hypothetical protein
MHRARGKAAARRALALSGVGLLLGATWLARDVESRPVVLPVPRTTEARLEAPSAVPNAGPVPDSARRLLAAARRTGPLRAVLGHSSVSILDAGRLVDGPRTVGTTMLLDLPVPRRDVSATVPDFGATARLRASLLNTVLVDYSAGRVVAIEPGPGSVTTTWTGPVHPAIPATAVRDPLLVQLSPGGPSVLTYDGAASLDPTTRDWPVSLVFAGDATVGKVKSALRSLGFTHTGHERYLAYHGRVAAGLVDGDRGLKTACDASSTDLHVRLYAPPMTDRFADPGLGSVVVATVHYDRNDGCGTGPRLYGFSELAEQQVAGAVSTRLGWRVERDRLALGNAEPLRRDVRNPAHVWLADGSATLIHVP